MAELLSGLDGTVYSVRRSLYDAKHIIQAKKRIKTAFQAQIQGLGFSVSNCYLPVQQTGA